MALLSGLGIMLSLVFGCLLLALVAELYYLLWWKKHRICNSNRIEEDYSNHTKELFYLFCGNKNKPTSITDNQNSNTILTNNSEVNDPDIELGLCTTNKDILLLKALGEDGMDSEIMRLHNLVGPPRFLFTIKEETKEDLESEDGKSMVDRKSLSDLVFLSPLSSPPLKISSNLDYKNNPLFECSLEGELNRLRSSPPPKFKFLRDAEEKLYRRLLEEAQKSGINNINPLKEDIDHSKDGSLMEIKVTNGGKNKEREVYCSSQVIPLATSPPTNPFSS